MYKDKEPWLKVTHSEPVQGGNRYTATTAVLVGGREDRGRRTGPVSSPSAWRQKEGRCFPSLLLSVKGCVIRTTNAQCGCSPALWWAQLLSQATQSLCQGVPDHQVSRPPREPGGQHQTCRRAEITFRDARAVCCVRQCPWEECHLAGTFR